MRVCDRHNDRPARDRIHIVNDDSYIDVCEECKTEVLTLLHAPRAEEPDKPRRGRPPKNLGNQIEAA